MKCRKNKHILALFLDGQLSEQQVLKLKAHLDVCPNCFQELNLLKKTWDVLGEWKPITPSPNFKARFWQKVFQEEVSLEKRPIFVFPRLRPRLAPVFATLTVVLIISSIFLTNLTQDNNLQRLSLLTKNEDISMLKELDLTQDFDIIKELHILEDLEIIDSIEL